jgi:phage-related protein
MATFTFTPTYDATEISEPRIRKFQAGDGYEQRITFGLHSDAKEWSLTFASRTDSQREDILTFLEARGGVESFDWTPPRGAAGKYVCEKWQTTIQSHNSSTIQATFRQVYEP